VEELKEIPALAATGEALARYALSLIPGSSFVKMRKPRGWVCKPNFIAFEIQSRRRKQIKFTIYRVPYDYEEYPVLPLQSTRNYSYHEFVVETPRQLGAAAVYIARAATKCARRKHQQDWEKGIGKL